MHPFWCDLVLILFCCSPPRKCLSSSLKECQEEERAKTVPFCVPGLSLVLGWGVRFPGHKQMLFTSQLLGKINFYEINSHEINSYHDQLPTRSTPTRSTPTKSTPNYWNVSVWVNVGYRDGPLQWNVPLSWPRGNLIWWELTSWELILWELISWDDTLREYWFS